MKHASSGFPQQYMQALRAHLDLGTTLPEAASEVAQQALAAEMTTLELAILHEDLLLTEVLADIPTRKQPAQIKRSAEFFAAVISSEVTTAGNKISTPDQRKIITQLSQRAHELVVAKRQLSTEITRRKAVEISLKASEAHHAKSLKDAKFLKDRLQALSRQILSLHEQERKKISKDLHDVVAQSLMGINVRLATLKIKTGQNTQEFNRTISSTQRLLTKTAQMVHQFASGLRPSVLDDIGLIPALHALMIDFSIRSGVRAELKASRKADKLADDSRTVLFRVAQEALTNVERHSAAEHVKVVIREIANCVVMTIVDDGKSFSVQQVLRSRSNKQLGLLGMRERVDMIGGSFEVESASGQGTKITVSLPVAKSLKSSK